MQGSLCIVGSLKALDGRLGRVQANDLARASESFHEMSQSSINPRYVLRY